MDLATRRTRRHPGSGLRLKKERGTNPESPVVVRKTAARKKRRLPPETLEVAGYILVLTTRTETDAANILELYRYRWQIERAFKRLRSLLQLGHLKTTDPEGAKAWLQGQLLIAVGERFSPRSYFLRATPKAPLA